MSDETYLAELAQNVCDLIAEAELLFKNRHWARAVGLAIYAGEQAITFDYSNWHPEKTPDTHAARGKIWNQHDQNAYESISSQNVFIPPQAMFTDNQGRARLEAKKERGAWYREQWGERRLPRRPKIPGLSDLVCARERCFYVDPGRSSPSSVTENEARVWIERAKKIAQSVGISSGRCEGESAGGMVP